MSKPIITIWGFLVYIFMPITGFGQQPIPYFKNLSVENGLPDNRISNIVQGELGFLWMGTRFGINRYDGKEVTSYPIKNNANINGFLKDKEDKLWVATSEGLFYYNKKKDRFDNWITKSKSFNIVLQSDIIELFQSNNGKIWLSNHKGQLVCFRPGGDENGKIYNIRSSAAVSSWSKITAIAEDNEGYLWIGTNAGELRRFDPMGERFIKSELENSFIGSHIHDMAIDTSAGMWVATNGRGVYKFELNSGISTQYTQEMNNRGNSINNNVVLSLMVDSKNNVWMGTDGGGLNLYRPQKDDFVYFKRRGGTETSLSDNSILCITRGMHDIIWLGTVHGGITYFKNNLDIFNIPPEKLFFKKDRQGSRILEDSSGNLWISAGRNGLRKYNTTTGEVSVFTDNINNPNGFNGSIVLSLMEDSTKRIWIGTLYEGLNVYDIIDKKFLKVPESKALNGVYAIEEQGNGDVWVGSNTGIIIYDSSLNIVKKINVQSGEGLSNDVITSIYKDVEGNMWVGTLYGLNVMRHNQQKFKTYFSVKNDNSTLSSNHILSVAEGPDLSIWVGTYGFGANRFSRSSGKFERIDKEDGLEGAIVRGILLDNFDNIWLSTNVGLSKIGAHGITNFGRKEGVPSFHGGAATLGADGRIFFAGERGLFYFWPNKLNIDPIAPKVFFTGLQILTEKRMKEIAFGKLNNDGKNIQKFSLGPDDKSMSVSFGSSNFWDPEKNSYAYKLKGLSNEWNTIGQQQSLSFSNLSPGDYILEVKVANKQGKWSPHTASFRFNVLPSFWQKKEVQIFGLLVFTSIVVLSIKWRSNRLKQQQDKLRNLIDSKTEEVKLQKDRIFKKDIDLLTAENENEKLKQRKLLDELNFRKEELTNNTLRTVHKNNLLTSIKEGLVKEMKRNPKMKGSLGNIINQIEDSLILDKDWKSFYDLFNQVHPMFIEDLKTLCPKLSDRDIRLCALIKLNFSSQHIATLFGISLSSVKVARHRLRKKLNIPEGVSFQDFLKIEISDRITDEL